MFLCLFFSYHKNSVQNLNVNEKKRKRKYQWLHRIWREWMNEYSEFCFNRMHIANRMWVSWCNQEVSTFNWIRPKWKSSIKNRINSQYFWPISLQVTLRCDSNKTEMVNMFHFFEFSILDCSVWFVKLLLNWIQVFIRIKPP